MVRALLCSVGLILGTSAAAAAQTVTPASTAASAPATVASAAPAQEPEATKRPRLWLGLALKSTSTPGDHTSSPGSVAFLWRWRGRTSRTDDRFAFAYRLGSYSSRMSESLGTQEVGFADARFRPILAGVDYKMPRGKWNWAAGVTAGWSLNQLTTDPYRGDVASRLGADFTADISNSFALSPRVKGWYDLHRRVSLMIEGSYNYTRPELTIRSGGVETTRRLNADALILKAGFVFGVW